MPEFYAPALFFFGGGIFGFFSPALMQNFQIFYARAFKMQTIQIKQIAEKITKIFKESDNFYDFYYDNLDENEKKETLKKVSKEISKIFEGCENLYDAKNRFISLENELPESFGDIVCELMNEINWGVHITDKGEQKLRKGIKELVADDDIDNLLIDENEYIENCLNVIYFNVRDFNCKDEYFEIKIGYSFKDEYVFCYGDILEYGENEDFYIDFIEFF